MAAYEYGRITRLAESLENDGVEPVVIAEILEGGEAMLRMNQYIGG